MFACVFAGVLISTGAANSSDRPIILKVALFDGCPFICPDESGPFVEGLKAAFKGSRYELNFKQVPFARAVKDLQSGKLDLLPGSLIGGIDGALYPESWLYFTRMCFFSSADDHWQWDGIASLKDRVIAVEKGIVHTPDFFEYVQFSQSVIHLSGGDILQRQLLMLDLGRIQSFTSEQTVLAHYLKQNNIAKDSVSNSGCFDPEFEYVAINSRHPDAQDIARVLTVGLAEYNRTFGPDLN